MYGVATVLLQKGSPQALRIPSSSLVSLPSGGDESAQAVYVVRDRKAHRTPVRVGIDSGIEAEILSGLKPTDLVVATPAGLTGEVVPVEVKSSSDSK
jgi:hypothetical protein